MERNKTKVNTYNTHVTKVTKPCGPLAQSVEHLTFNQGVPRSSRGWITIFLHKKSWAEVMLMQLLQSSFLFEITVLRPGAGSVLHIQFYQLYDPGHPAMSFP